MILFLIQFVRYRRVYVTGPSVTVWELEQDKIHYDAADKIHNDIAHSIHQCKALREHGRVAYWEKLEDLINLTAGLIDGVLKIPVLSISAEELVVSELKELPSVGKDKAEAERSQRSDARRTGLLELELERADIFITDINAFRSAGCVQDLIVHRQCVIKIEIRAAERTEQEAESCDVLKTRRKISEQALLREKLDDLVSKHTDEIRGYLNRRIAAGIILAVEQRIDQSKDHQASEHPPIYELPFFDICKDPREIIFKISFHVYISFRLSFRPERDHGILLRGLTGRIDTGNKGKQYADNKQTDYA